MCKSKNLMGFLTTFAFVAFSLSFGVTAMGALIETQTFDSEASATAAGWVESNSRVAPNDFGFSDTNNAEGASAGEGGGIVPRFGGSPHSYYADTTVLGGGPMGDLTIDLHAEGTAKFQNINADGEYYFGWFNSVRAGFPDSTDDVLGFRVFEDQGSGWRARALINGNTDGGDDPVPGETSLHFVIDWNATTAHLDVTWTDGATVWQTFADGFNDMTWDAFGLMANDGGPDSRSLNFWFDDLSYTTIPEPATMALLALGGLAALRRRRK